MDTHALSAEIAKEHYKDSNTLLTNVVTKEQEGIRQALGFVIQSFKLSGLTGVTAYLWLSGLSMFTVIGGTASLYFTYTQMLRTYCDARALTGSKQSREQHGSEFNSIFMKHVNHGWIYLKGLVSQNSNKIQVSIVPKS